MEESGRRGKAPLNSTHAPTTKVIDFSMDSDQEPDSNGSYTGATLEKEVLPQSFTICVAYMVEAWTTVYTSATIITLMADEKWDGDMWGYVQLYVSTDFTEYEVILGPTHLLATTPALYSSLHWTRVCVPWTLTLPW